ncbi:MAG: hypothetical protein Q9207_007063, partial [Kuettlingeria erythrocarpa]
MFALHNIKAQRPDRPSLPHNYSFLPKQQPSEDTMMETLKNSGLRRRSVHSNKEPPQAPIPVSTAAASVEEIDPLDPAPPLTPRRRRRSTGSGFQHFEAAKEKKSGFFGGRWLRRDVVNWGW